MATYLQAMSDAAYYKKYGTGEEAIKARIRQIYLNRGYTTINEARINDIYNRRKGELAKSFDQLRADIEGLAEKQGIIRPGQTLNNVPGKPEVWKVGSKTYLVYMVPGTEKDPVYMSWEAPSQADVQSWFGPGKKIIYNRTLTDAQFRAMGAIDFGSTDEIPPGAKDPFSTWETDVATQAKTQPWILDDDYAALMAMSILEGRPLTEAEIATTTWWKSHTKAERDWMILYHGDPEEAKRKLEDDRAYIRQLLIDAGAGEVGEDVIEYIAGQFSMGHWSGLYTQNQIKALTDKYSGIALDAGLAKMDLASVGQTQAGEDEVRDLIATWLGPAFGEWSETEVAKVAGQIRNDPDAKQAFVEQLKDQRMALFPEYTDRNLSYAAIANPWRQWWIGQWGETPDETDALFLDVLKMNDAEESGKLLRREGLARGVGKVASDLSRQTVNLSNMERRPILNG